MSTFGKWVRYFKINYALKWAWVSSVSHREPLQPSCEPQALLHCSGYVVASQKLTVLESPLLTYWSCNYRLCIFGAQDHWKPNNHNEQLILHFTASFLVHTPFGWPHCNNYNTSIFLLEYKYCQFSSVQSLSSVQFFATSMNRSTPGLPVHHQLLEFTQTHVHRVGDTIQPSHPLSSPSPPAPDPSQHQGLFQWVNFSHEVAKVLEFQL